jgi:superfamily II DNA or RNA helicase
MKRAERQQLGAIIKEVRSWANAAREARRLVAHLPLSPFVLSPDDEALLESLASGAVESAADEAARLARPTWFDGRKGLQPAYQAAERVTAFHHDVQAAAGDARLQALRAELGARASAEQAELRQALADLQLSWSLARQALHDASHLPVTRSGALSYIEVAEAEAIIKVVTAHQGQAASLLAKACGADDCSAAHSSARALRQFHAEARESGALRRIGAVASRVSRQRADEVGRLPAVLADFRLWYPAAYQALEDVRHLSLTREGALTDDEAESLRELIAVCAAHLQVAGTFHPGMCDAGACGAIHQPLADLCAYHEKAVNRGRQFVTGTAERIAVQTRAERAQLATMLDDLDQWCSAAVQALHGAKHMPLTRSGVLSEQDRAAMRTVIERVSEYGSNARAVADATGCQSGNCQARHDSAVLLGQFHGDALRSGTGITIMGWAERVAAQLRDEQHAVARLYQRMVSWPGYVNAAREIRAHATTTVQSRAAQLMSASVGVTIDRMPMRLFPLGPRDDALAASLTLLRDKPLLEADERLLAEVKDTARSAMAAIEAGFTADWACHGDSRCTRAHQLLPGVYQRADQNERDLGRLQAELPDMPSGVSQLGDPSLGLANWLPGQHGSPELLPEEVTRQARGGLTEVIDAAAVARKAEAAAHAAADSVRAGDVATTLKGMDLEALRKAAPQGKIRVAPLEDYSLHNVWDVLQFQQEDFLESLEGIGEASAQAIAQATLRLYEAVRNSTPVRIDVRQRSELTLRLLEALRRWDITRRFDPSRDELALATALVEAFRQNGSATRVLAMAERASGEPLPSLGNLLSSALERATPSMGDVDIWQDFLSRPADYFGMITELGFTTEDQKKMHGDLPEEIVEAVRAKDLRREFLTASPRAYQSFGARFALVQERVVIGDEMGLGKTIEALAVLAHLRAVGRTHFLVVCPAAVVTNWMRETRKHTSLQATRLHGLPWERNSAARSWIRSGGVAVTTYDLLPWAREHVSRVEVGCVIFDEAHYIKNPRTKRSLAAAGVLGEVKHAVLMTGTPLENSVQEFRNLIGYIRPDLSESAPEYLPALFRKHVAPVYLRRNQEDVLTELPELIEAEEWLGMSAGDDRAYRKAVQDGSFADMRRAAMLSGQSLKVERLTEIVAEAKANGRRVIVFSFFREVLAEVVRMLPGQVFGPLDGSMAADRRQSLIDEFSDAGAGAVLIAQIRAGGVGLNIQAASVVIFCEPQVTPAWEDQAIARAHRSGQVNTVQVHRLLTEDSVDERIRDIVARKRQLFDEFARDSVIAQEAPDAVDVSEAELARIVVAAERERIFKQTANLLTPCTLMIHVRFMPQ